MRFCTHCGAQVPDNAKFCTACGTSIDAPDEANVVISDPDDGETVEASGSEGEFTAASWSPSRPSATEATPPQARPAPQPQPVRPIQPIIKEASKTKKKGFFSYVWLFLKVLIIAVLAVMLAVFLRGVYIGYTSSADNEDIPEQAPASQSVSKTKIKTKVVEDDGFQSLDELTDSEREEYTNALMGRTDNKVAREKKVTVGTVTFLLSGEYKIASRERLQNGEACIIVPKDATNQRNRLKLVVVPGDSEEAYGFTSEEMYGFLSGALDELEEELAEGKYDMHYEDNSDGKYFPHCYCFRNLQNPRAYTYTEATFVSGNLLSGCCVATDEAELAALMEIYSAAVVGAFI